MKPKHRKPTTEGVVQVELPSNTWRYDREEQEQVFQLKDINLINLPRSNLTDLAVKPYPEPVRKPMIKHVFDTKSYRPTSIPAVKPSVEEAVPTVVEKIETVSEDRPITEVQVKKQIDDPEEWLDDLLG